jgi:hypothetical protein
MALLVIDKGSRDFERLNVASISASPTDVRARSGWRVSFVQ